MTNTLDIEPQMIEEVNGIDMTELEYHEWIESINYIISHIQGNSSIIKPEEVSPSCQCPVELWKSSDSNDGTGDHEAFM